MQACAIKAVWTDNAEGLAGRTGLAILVAPFVKQLPRRVGTARADELFAEGVRNARVRQRPYARLHGLPFVTRKHQFGM